MSSKKLFKVDDKVFAKIRGYPAWPAVVSAVKSADTPSKTKYNVYFYGTGERADCKPEDLCPYEENKSKLGKPNKRKYFADALKEIEHDSEIFNHPKNDSQTLITPSNKSTVELEKPSDVINVGETEKIREANLETEEKSTNDESTLSKAKKVMVSKKSLGISMSKGTKRKLSDIKPEGSSKMSMTNKPKTSEQFRLKHKHSRPIILVEKLKDSLIEKATGNQTSETEDKKSVADNQTIETDTNLEANNSDVSLTEAEAVIEKSDINLDSMKTAKSPFKVKDSPTSNTEISSNSSNVGQVSRSGRKIKPKTFSDYENDGEVHKRSRMSKGSSKITEKQNSSSTVNNQSQEQNGKIKDASSSSEIKKMSKTETSASPLLMNDPTTEDIHQVANKIKEDSELPVELKGLIVDSISSLESGWKKTAPNKLSNIEVLHAEVEMLDCIYSLRISLRTEHADYEVALDALEHLSEIQISPLMLKKHREVVDTVKQVAKYIGNAEEWGLDEQEIKEHREKINQVRRKAVSMYNKFVSLFTVPDGESFQEIFTKEVDEFYNKTKHLTSDQIYGMTSDKLINNL